MKVKKKALEVFTVPEKEVREYLFIKVLVDTPPEVWEIKEVELTDRGVEFTFFEDEVLKKYKGASPAELKARGEMALNAIWDRVKKGEITATKSVELAEQEPHSRGIHVITFDEDEMLRLIYNMRFPSFWGSFFKSGAWAEVGAFQKITKVELTNDGVEFTIVKT